MANQMIALQARAPQSSGLGSAIQQGAQMVNAMRQQEAAARQAEMAQQQMKLAQSKEARDIAAADREAQKFALEREALIYAKHRRRAPGVIESGSPEVYAAFVQDMAADAPQDAAALLRAMPVEKFDPAVFARIMATMDQQFEARHGKAITKEMVSPEGVPLGVNISSIPGATYGTPIPDISKPRANTQATPVQPTPTQTLRPPTEFDLAFAEGIPAAPEAIDAAARAIAEGKNINDPRIRGLSKGDFEEAQRRASRLFLDQPELQQMSAQTAPQADLGQIVQNMMDTGVVSQADFEAMRAAAPGKDAQLAQILRENNIQIMPGEQQPGGMRSAVYRPEEGAPAFQQVQYDPNAYEPVRVKSPMQSPTPGAYNVPTTVIREKARAERKSPQEIYDEKRMEKQAEADVNFIENAAKGKESGLMMLDLIGQMIGDATVKNGMIDVQKGKRAPKAGFEDVVGATWRPGWRFVSGTDAANFDALLKQVEGQTFLKAYETLKGTGQITEIEGQKATDAMTRMKRSVSEVDFVKAAREFADIVQKGLDRIEQREAKLGGLTGSVTDTGDYTPYKPAQRRTPTKKSAPKELRYNPATGEFE